MWEFIKSKEWMIFMNLMRIATFILIAVLIYIMIKEIGIVKLLASDPCLICMNKTGATCWIYP